MMNMKIAVPTLVLAMFVGVNAMAAQQTTCPLMGGKINKKIYADHDGKRVYFCCAGCVGKFKKDPAKYIKQLEDQGVTLEKTPDEHHKDMSHQDSEKKKKKAEHGGHQMH